MVEMAVVLPLLLLLVFGTIELGLAFRTYLTASSAASSGSRMLALMGNDELADCHALTEVAAALGTGDSLDDLVDVQIFEANTNGSQGATNTWSYTGGDPADCDTGWSGSSGNWDPVDRDVTAGGDTDLDIGGVTVTVTHNWITGLPPFSGGFEIAETTLTRLEPEAFAND
jgi:Flp pilus assembly protein TadG